MKTNKANKVYNYAFIDWQNLHQSIIEQKWTLDYQKFRVYLSHRFRVVKAIYFLGYLPKYQWLYANLRQSGYILSFKHTSRDWDNKIKGNVDAELILSAIIRMPYYDKAIIVGGDGDYYGLTKYLIRRRKLGGIVIPSRHNYSTLLKRYTKNMIYLDNLRNRLEKFKKQ